MELQIDVQNLNFQQLIENCFNSVSIIGQEGKILYGNKACLKLLNLAFSHDLLHKSLYTFLHPDFHAICKQRLKRVFENQEKAEMMEQKMIKSNGEVINIRVMAVPFHIKDQVLAQVIIEDITDRKKAEELLYHREKLDSLGQIAASIAHEVKNPLTSVKGFLQLLKESYSHPYIDTMETELGQALNTLQSLLQVSKPDLDIEPYVPIELCKELTSILSLFQERFYNVELEMDLRDSERKVIGKKNLLYKAFFNLFKNALEAIQDKGKLRIEHYFDNGWVHVKVSDTGIGIPEEKLKMLGTPFFSTKSDGTGLGLTQVFSTIHEHGGNVCVHSVVGQGTTFHVQLAEIKV